eukprot:Clim_evm5s206 gene=Clim_evmTU5s206
MGWNMGHRWYSTPYVHPYSAIVLDTLKADKPDWFDEAKVEMAKDGTFLYNLDGKGEIRTYFDNEVKSHFLTFESGDIKGKYALYDGTKQAWQQNTDYDKIAHATQDLIDRINKAT